MSPARCSRTRHSSAYHTRFRQATLLIGHVNRSMHRAPFQFCEQSFLRTFNFDRTILIPASRTIPASESHQLLWLGLAEGPAASVLSWVVRLRFRFCFCTTTARRLHRSRTSTPAEANRLVPAAEADRPRPARTSTSALDRLSLAGWFGQIDRRRRASSDISCTMQWNN